jgi:predicted nucleic acid-binding protein
LRQFFDTNVLVYANVEDRRRLRALALIGAGGGYISAQILNEFTSVMRSKLKRPWEDIEAALQDIADALPVVLPLTQSTHSAAFAIARANALNFYDALVIASALEGGCDTLWSEDLQDGRVFGPLVLRNPFLP